MYGDIRGEVPEGEYLIPLGVAEVKRTGKDVTIVSFGKIIKEAYTAAEKLAEEGLNAKLSIWGRCVPWTCHSKCQENQPPGNIGRSMAVWKTFLPK